MMDYGKVITGDTGGGRRSKYGARRTVQRDTATGEEVSFASALEAELDRVLAAIAARGQLRVVERQPRIFLTDARIEYRADFKTVQDGGRIVLHDAKGEETDVFKLKLRLFVHYGPPWPLVLWRKKSRNAGLTIDRTVYPRSFKAGGAAEPPKK